MAKEKAKSKVQTTELTSKQAEVRITSLLRGIDNDSAAIAQKQAKVASAVEQVKQLIPALGNKAAVEQKQPAEKAAKPAKVEKTIKTKVKQTKVKTKPKTAGAVKPSPDAERVPLKSVIQEILATHGEPVPAATIFQTATEKYGKWSRQSLYNALKDTKLFERVGDGYQNTGSESTEGKQLDAETQDQDEADRFVSLVEAQQSTQSLL